MGYRMKVLQDMSWNTRWYMWLGVMTITGIGCCLVWWQLYVYTSLVREVSSLHAFYQTLPHIVFQQNSESEPEDVHTFIALNRNSHYLMEEAEQFLRYNRPKTRRMMMPRTQRNRQSQYTLQQRSAPLRLPIQRNKFWISSLFGPRKQASGHTGYHYGVDFAASRGTPVYACAEGKVVHAGWHNGFGNVVVIAHENGLRTRYAHLSAIYVTSGAYVAQSAKIAAVGDTGRVRKNGRDASHLHLEVERHGKREDPLSYLNME